MSSKLKVQSVKERLKNKQQQLQLQEKQQQQQLPTDTTPSNNKLINNENQQLIQQDVNMSIEEGESVDLNKQNKQNEDILQNQSTKKGSLQDFKKETIKNDPKFARIAEITQKTKEAQKKHRMQFSIDNNNINKINPNSKNLLKGEVEQSPKATRKHSGDPINEETNDQSSSVRGSQQGFKEQRDKINMIEEIKKKRDYKPLKNCKNDAKRLYIEIVSLQGVNLSDTIKCKIELVDIDNIVIQQNNEQCSKTRLLHIKKESKKLMQFEYLQIFPVNENILNEQKAFKPRLQITLYMENTGEVVGFIDTNIVDKKTNKIKKGHFIKKLFKYDSNISDYENQMKTPFKLGILLYRDIPYKWEPMIGKPYLTDFDSGFVFTLENIQYEKKKWYQLQNPYDSDISLATEFALINNGKVMKDHNLDSIIYTTVGFNKFDESTLRVDFQYQQRLFLNWEMLFDMNRNNLHKLFIVVTVFKKISAFGNEREEYGWFVHPLFRVREYNSGQFTVNMFKPPMENKVKYNFDEYEKINNCKLNFNFLGFQEHQNNSYLKEKVKSTEHLDEEQHSPVLSPQNVNSQENFEFNNQQSKNQFISINNENSMNTTNQSKQRKKFMRKSQQQDIENQNINNKNDVIQEEDYNNNQAEGSDGSYYQP